MLLLLLSAFAGPAQAQDCSSIDAPVVDDLVAVVEAAPDNAGPIDNVLAFLDQDPTSAKHEAHAVAEDIRADDRLDPDLAEAWLTELGTIWGLADTMEEAALALEERDCQGAMDLAHEAAEAARDAEELLGSARMGRIVAAMGQLWTEGRDDCVPALDTTETLHADGSRSFQLEVPYASQRDNRNRPRATCQNTAVAMGLSYVLDQDLDADDVWADTGGNSGRLYSADRMERYARSAGASGSESSHGNLDAEALRDELDAGHPFVFQGYFVNAGYGHVVLVVGYKEDAAGELEGFYLHDPWGRDGDYGDRHDDYGSTDGAHAYISVADLDRESLCGTAYCGAVLAP